MDDPALVVATPRARVHERDYVLNVVLKEFLGLAFRITRHDSNIVTLSLSGALGTIELPDLLFSVPEGQWMSSESLPREPVTRLTTVENSRSLPALYCDAQGGPTIVEQDESSLRISFDLFGSCFFMLTRYEEHVADPTKLDLHGRFPAHNSLLTREEILERPIVDEYLEILRHAMNRLWPGFVPVRNQNALIVTHDIDHPVSSYGQALRLAVRRTMGDVLLRHDPVTAYRRIKAWISNDVDSDPNNTFDWLMDRSEEVQAISRFHFMAATQTRYDSGYDIGAQYLQPIFRRIADRGHEIGLHPSYRTSDDESLFGREKQRLEQALHNASIDGWSQKSRQHYLRWNAHTTWRNLESIGICVDSSLCFADAAGFRCGTSRTFPVFDLSRSETLALMEQPLIVMDATLTGKNYLGLDWDGALQKISNLAAICQRYGAPFTLLWHNDKVLTQLERRRYKAVLRACA